MQFEPLEQWIWLPASVFPEQQTTALTCMSSAGVKNHAVVQFTKTYTCRKPIESVELRTSGDTFFRLYLNGDRIVSGPASVGGDFLGNDFPRPQFYATGHTVTDNPGFAAGTLAFTATVRMGSVRMFEYSMGHGGFFLTAHVRFTDGTKTVLRTDETWTAQLLPAHTAATVYDGTIPTPAPVQAERVPNLWHTLTSPIPSLTEEKISLTPITVPAGETVETTVPLAMIYTGYPAVDTDTAGKLRVTLRCIETEGGGTGETYTFTEPTSYVSTFLCSAGKLRITACNEGTAPATLIPAFVLSHYPTPTCASTTTSDADLNLVLDVCTHTLKYCRQTLHLDSGSHCEPMACTGDYYIESLMTDMNFGDLRLAAFDVRRTAQLLRYNDGRMFHTTYSLIWVQMLWDVYRYAGETALLTDCEDALTILLERFSAYLGENGILENPPDYMFIDWLIPDGISTHHPPKALGQTCLNLFYYGALRTASEIYAVLDEPAMSAKNAAEAEILAKNVRELLYDAEKGLFFEGLNTPTPEHLVGKWMPQNVEKRYYRKHANILAAYFGIADKPTCQQILHKVMTDEALGNVQPYFAHFLLEAVYRNGLRDTYTLQILEEWKEPVRDCPYGLAEGFHKPEPTYSFDHSHAWGGTPSYALPLALSGLELVEPAYKKIRLNPSLLGLTQAYTEIPTPYGNIVIDQTAGKAASIQIPDGIELV